VVAAYLDVDLAASTRECLKYLYPLLRVGGVLISQDGHLPLVIQVLDDDVFWSREVGCAKPAMPGLGRQKLIRIVKEAPCRGAAGSPATSVREGGGAGRPGKPA
jgi:O-methyltransferase